MDLTAFEPDLAAALQAFRDCTPLFEAMADRSRQDILVLLAAEARLNVGEIAARIPLSRPAVSHHLKVLRQAGLVSLERVSRENFYALSANAALARLRRFVDVADAVCV